jgi:PPOX class probable F420-dependent enzyme
MMKFEHGYGRRGTKRHRTGGEHPRSARTVAAISRASDVKIESDEHSSLGGHPVKIPQDVKNLIESGCPAHLVTLNRDGSPQVTIVWIGLDGDELVAGHLPRNRKVKNIQRDPRVAVSLEADTKSSMGLTEYAVLYGEARIQEGGAPELLQRLAEVYIGPGVKFPPMENPPPGYVTRIRVDRIEGVGPWTGRPV